MAVTDSPAGNRVRRTQAERTAETRRALLDATFDALVEVGYKATTTTEVAHRAGVSLGALLHHFPTKADLLTAAVTRSFDRRIEEFQDLMAGLDPAADKLDAAVDLLWSLYCRPTFTAWYELWTAARTDPDLATAVVAIDRQFMAACRQIYAELFPARADADPAFADGIGLDIVLTLLTGLATSQTLSGYEPHPPRAVLDAFKVMCRAVLGSATVSRAE
ncbi:TetR/AcrR family transcriptional regulator [Nocardia stercoris]|uniref:TetR/AcrR family transcriptional regulator n=1 Tax=Nocardia stercoris TaxID=2483361 RepID=A0A3M2LFF0_9NOCA|nr:TetR/AcrR family transcriptional regulator [Nocardia stercoris]RMI33408.1 TetR/AcrR family transcriptional regulator [Nocardia stercoris]